MIKGVNKKVIEINRPDSAYFERAVLYLKPNVKDIPLHLENMDTFPIVQKSRHSLKNWIIFLSGMFVSAVVCCAMMRFLP